MTKLHLTLLLFISSTTYAGDSSVSSLLDIKPVKIPDIAKVSPCRSHITYEVKQGARLQPSNACRVINYYIGKSFMGAVRVPLGVEYEVPWRP